MNKKTQTQGLAEAAGANVARLVAAARDDPTFRSRLLFVIRLPAFQRMSLIRTAVAEMRLKREKAADILAFSAIEDDAFAAAVRREIEDQP